MAMVMRNGPDDFVELCWKQATGMGRLMCGGEVVRADDHFVKYSCFIPHNSQHQDFDHKFVTADEIVDACFGGCYNPNYYPSHHRHQDFDYFVAIDFEATCDKNRVPQPQEIIEFPSVIVNAAFGKLEDCFQTYVRPTCNPVLSEFCKDLTGIQQNKVDRGVSLSQALFHHDEWLTNLGIKDTNFAVVTWTDWDCQVMLDSECRYKNIVKPYYFNRWINLKVAFQEVFGPVRCNFKQAVEMAGLEWQGRAHSGLDDAKNTARLLAHLMRMGYKFSITKSTYC